MHTYELFGCCVCFSNLEEPVTDHLVTDIDVPIPENREALSADQNK